MGEKLAVYSINREHDIDCGKHTNIGKRRPLTALQK
jgi:hypothetical protein